jgi:cysteine desulfurase/selenocysteine lyase
MVRKEVGIELKVIPITDKGELDLSAYQDLLSANTALVAVSHVSNALGTINPVKKMVEQAHQYDIPVLIDGAQAVPHTPVDVQEIDCDFYVFSAHKMFGPTGIGILYGKEYWLEKLKPFKGGGEMIDKVTFEETTFDDLPHKLEAGTPPIAAGIGLGAAIRYIENIGITNIKKYEDQLLEYGADQLSSVEGLNILGTADHKASVLSFVFDDIHAHDVGTLLNEQGIAVRTGHHCAQPVMQRFGVPATTRASLALYNNKNDIDRLVQGLTKMKEIFS